MSSVLPTFLKQLPDWVEVIEAADLPASVVVRTDPIGTELQSVDLLLKPGPQEPYITEHDTKSKQLPDFCYERHIMRDSSFCLGHIEGANNLNHVESFWLKLKAFLENQDYAARRGVWPIEQGMSHTGTSMKAQKLIENKIRSDESLLQDWLLSAFRGRGWIAKIAHRPLDKPDPKLTNRQACPRGCSKQNTEHSGCKLDLKGKTPRKGKKDDPILIGDCKDAELISDILVLEHIRFSADQLLYESIIQNPQEGIECCGTMKTCPLNVGAKLC